MTPSCVRYLWDEGLLREANADCRNYWFAGFPDVADQMGLTADELGRAELTAQGLQHTRVLILPNLSAEYLTPAERAALTDWVGEGGTLVGLATQGLDELFGVVEIRRLEQPGDPWSCSAMLRLTDEELTRPLYNAETLDAPLLIISPVRVLSGAQQRDTVASRELWEAGLARGAQGWEKSPPGGSALRELARLLSKDGEDLGAPAVTLRGVGRGRVCYFAFDLCHTIWALHQGRPVYTDRDGDGYFRLSDAIVIRPFRIDVPYADLLLLLLRNVISLAGVSFIYPLPPTADGRVPDAVFYYGGDDEADAGKQVFASDFMRGHGLPYHINIMPRRDGSFALTRAEFDHIKANGHETSLHLNFITDLPHPYAYTEQEIRQQVGWYEQTFGEMPVCSVFHWVTWHQWSEPAEWMAACGLQADNSRIHAGSPPLNPANLCGYSFGTAYPFWYRSDWRRQNRRVDFLSEQIVAYECGYRANQGTDFAQLHRAIRDAAYWHLTTNFFFHPVCIHDYPACREAIAELVRYTAEQGLRVVHMGNDELNRWWRARSATRVQETAQGAVAACPWPTGCILVRRAKQGVAELGGTWEYRVTGSAG